ncbi:MAG TPA: hypothetical protein VH210_01185 [Gaiellaceae bacterium]|jgi:hypothetical protein|nr:hypothetical protein [Gaiellaceae bacterium]
MTHHDAPFASEGRELTLQSGKPLLELRAIGLGQSGIANVVAVRDKLCREENCQC